MDEVKETLSAAVVAQETTEQLERVHLTSAGSKRADSTSLNESVTQRVHLLETSVAQLQAENTELRAANIELRAEITEQGKLLTSLNARVNSLSQMSMF